jgi:hypothetical protein
MKVSWQVTGIRKDPWANVHRVQVEEDKPNEERGYYIYPDLYNQPALSSRCIFLHYITVCFVVQRSVELIIKKIGSFFMSKLVCLSIVSIILQKMILLRTLMWQLLLLLLIVVALHKYLLILAITRCIIT